MCTRTEVEYEIPQVLLGIEIASVWPNIEVLNSFKKSLRERESHEKREMMWAIDN